MSIIRVPPASPYGAFLVGLHTHLWSWLRLGFCMLALWPLSSSLQAESPRVIRIATGEYPPFASEADPKFNLINTIVTEAFAQSKLKVEFDFFPWARTYKEALSGKYDATSYWYKSPDRKAHFYFSEVIVESPTYFFHLRSRPLQWNTLNDLAGKQISVTRGYTYSTEFIQAGSDGLFTLHWTNSDTQNLKMLLSGRTEIFPMELYPAYHLFKTLNPAQTELLTYHPKPLVESTGHLLFPKKLKNSKRLLSRFNAGLAKLKKSGRLEQILSTMQTQDSSSQASPSQ